MRFSENPMLNQKTIFRNIQSPVARPGFSFVRCSTYMCREDATVRLEADGVVLIRGFDYDSL